MQDIDLPPSQWKSSGPKRREPIFGPGAGPLLGGLVCTALALLALVSIAYLGTQAKYMMYGEPQRHSPELGLGETTTIDGYKITRTH